ncbi:uncharacterized protein LOC136033649 isoform X2 [Artemia franciscana]|uniref:uncharacterized protein LOC136033649 isoform X2 n=1 Tax=Artemia franciscana TaxID=6661 RepID=UPI0032DA1ABD
MDGIIFGKSYVKLLIKFQTEIIYVKKRRAKAYGRIIFAKTVKSKIIKENNCKARPTINNVRSRESSNIPFYEGGITFTTPVLPKKRERDQRNREMFEKVFPELRKQRGDKERLSRASSRIKSDTNLERSYPLYPRQAEKRTSS